MHDQRRREEPVAYRGHSLLNTCLASWPRQLLLMTADLWNTHFVMRGIEWPGGAPARMPGNGWTVRTNMDSTHNGVAGAYSFTEDGYRVWEYSFTPGMPEGTRALEVAITTDARATQAMDILPIVRQPHEELAESDAEPSGDDSCFGCAAGPQSTVRCPSCTSVDIAVAGALGERPPGVPSELIPLGVDLGRFDSTNRVLCALELWPSSFDLLLEAHGPQHDVGGPLVGGTWSLHDDLGNRYVGVAKSGAGGNLLSESVRVVCGPQLHTEASVLTLTFLDPFGANLKLGTTIELGDGQRRTPLADC